MADCDRLSSVLIKSIFGFLISVCLAVVFVVSDSLAQESESRFDWPSFLGPDRNSRSMETGILRDWSNGKLKVLWERPIGRGYVLGSIADGRFFQFDAKETTCRLICRNAATGEEIWDFGYEFEYTDMYQFEAGPRATPVVDGDRVYIYGVEGMLHCIDIKTGKSVWKIDVNEKYGVVQNFFGVGSTPMVVDDALIVMVGGSPDEFRDQTNNRLDIVKPNGTAVVAFDKRSGKQLYAFGNDLASYSSINTYRVAQKLNAVAWLRDAVVGFEVKNGKQLWSYPYRARKYESVNASTPVVQGTKIFLCESYGPGSLLLDVANEKPNRVWNDTNPRKQALATHWNTPVFHEGFLYACHGEGRANCEIRCIEFDTGTVKWKQRGYGRSSLTYIDGHFVVLDERGELFLIKAKPESFELVSKYSNQKGEGLNLNYPCWAAPVIANGRLYVRGRDRLVCLQLISNN